MAARVDWFNALQLEQAFFKCLVKQKQRGFLVDRDRLEFHLDNINARIDEIDEEVLPNLPYRIVPREQKKAGEFSWLKKPFKKSGALCQKAEEWCEEVGWDEDILDGPFSRIDLIPFDLGSAAQVKNYLLAEGWEPEEWNYSKLTGDRTSPKLSQSDAFLGVEGGVGKLVAERMQYRHRRSLLEGIRKIIRPDGRVVSGVSGIAVTGRLKHTGIVNIPGGKALYGKECREIFVAQEGYRIVGCDAASCQLRMLCHYMGDHDYTEAVINGQESEGTDVHTLNMRMAGLDDRRKAKSLIYAFLFGASDRKLAVTLGCSVKRAKEIRKTLLEAVPLLDKLISMVHKIYKDRGYLIGLDGRKIVPSSPHQCLVYLLQGAEAILMKVATCYAHKWIDKRNLNAHMVTHQHDEFQWEVEEEHSEEVKELLEESIVKAGQFLKLSVPMSGEGKIGYNWHETH